MHKIYNPKGFEINPEDVVLDIGGHIGVFSIMAARIAKKVYVFEPVDKNFKLLIENIKLNGFKNVVPEKLALSDKNGKRKIYVSETNTGDNSLYDRKVSKTNPELIRTETLKKFIRKNKIKKIDFLKMDCEGSEYDILYNISDEIIKKIGKMVIEHHFIDNKDKNGFLLKKFLESRGFKVRMHKDMLYAKNLLLN